MCIYNTLEHRLMGSGAALRASILAQESLSQKDKMVSYG
jgi:hypothetical protein